MVREEKIDEETSDEELAAIARWRCCCGAEIRLVENSYPPERIGAVKLFQYEHRQCTTAWVMR